LTPEESGAWTAAAQAAGLETVFLVAPSSPVERIDKVAEVTTGFIYAASTMGVTGARASVGVRAHELVDRIRARSTSPVAVGLGVSAPDQAREVAAYADGVIVGSAFIRLLIDAETEADGTRAVAELAGELAIATHQPR
jgi:tryptophan synthase alpha chain